jgi:hypothetical protein
MQLSDVIIADHYIAVDGKAGAWNHDPPRFAASPGTYANARSCP